MSKKDLITAFIKLLGFSSFFGSLISLLGTLYYIVLDEKQSFSSQLTDIGLYVIYMGVSVTLMFYGDKITNFFRLNKGYERDYIALDNLSAVDIIKVGVFLIGGMFFMENLPYTVSWLVQRFSSDVSGINMNIYDTYSLFIAGAKLVFGYLMMTNFGRIAKWFVRWNKEE